MGLTVSAMPTRTKPKLKLCCVALAAFSPAESSLHGTKPSSLNAVTLRRRAVGEELAPRPVCVAYDRDRRRGPMARAWDGRSASIQVVGFIMAVYRRPSSKPPPNEYGISDSARLVRGCLDESRATGCDGIRCWSAALFLLPVTALGRKSKVG